MERRWVVQEWSTVVEDLEMSFQPEAFHDQSSDEI